MGLINANGTRWNVYGCLVLLVLPFVPWLVYNYETELIVGHLNETGASIVRILTMAIVAIGWARFLMGPRESSPQVLVKGSGNKLNSTKRDDSILTSENNSVFNTTPLDLSPPHTIQQAIRLMDQVLPKVSYDALSEENKLIANANVYLQYGRTEQALNLLKEIPYPSSTTKQLIGMVSAVVQQSDKKND